MSSSFLRLPPTIRRQIWLKSCSSAGPINPSTSFRQYATVYTPGQDKLWDEPLVGLPPNPETYVSETKNVLRAAQSALDKHSSASSAEKGRLLRELRNLINEEGFSQQWRSSISEKVGQKFTDVEVVRSIQDALFTPNGKPAIIELRDSNLERVPASDAHSYESQWSPERDQNGETRESLRSLVREYPYAPRALFNPSKTLRQLKADCDRLARQVHVKLVFSQTDQSGAQNCTIRLQFEPTMEISATGAGRDQGKAKDIACSRLILQLHARGVLEDIYYQPGHEIYPGGERPPPGTMAHWSYIQEAVELPAAALEQYRIQDIDREIGRSNCTGIEGMTHLMPHLERACWRQNIKMDWQGKHYLRNKTYGYEINVSCGDVTAVGAVGEGIDRPSAIRAAKLHLLGKMHSNGSLQQIFPTTIAMERPIPELYPSAPTGLFSPETAISAMNELAQGNGMSLNITASSERVNSLKVNLYDLSVEFPGLTTITAKGEGENLKIAKQEAWMQVITSLHKDGALSKLLAPDIASKTEPEADLVDADATLDDAVDLGSSNVLDSISLDDATRHAERNAKIEIYNFAAGLGFVPEFESKVYPVPTKMTRRRRIRTKARKHDQTFIVTILLPALDIHVAGSGVDIQAAEVAAAVAFKREAETKSSHHIRRDSNFQILSSETAPQFFEFLRASGRPANLELEHESAPVGGISQNRVRLRINGENEWSVTMGTKAEAETVVHLIAAVSMATEEPDLLPSFAEALQMGKGQILRKARSMVVRLESPTLETMRHALIEARQSGLPDVKEILPVDETTSGPWRPRRADLTDEQRTRLSQRLRSRSNSQERNTSHEADNNTVVLPMSQYADQVLDMISRNTYSIVIGATGSGKTTQVPQIVLDDAIRRGQGGFCDIICTQPRRLAASSVAQRVAVERGQPLRQSVGYQVRHDAQLPRSGGSITYCTTGILLERLRNNPDILGRVSHLVLDEVHERDLQLDLLLILLKQAVQARQSMQLAVPKIIFMSATMDAEIFSRYFAIETDGDMNPCPAVSVPGRTFPVKHSYLQDLLSDMRRAHGSEFEELLELDRESSDYIQSEVNFRRPIEASAQQTTAIDWKRKQMPELETGGSSLSVEKEEALVPVALTAATIAHVCTATRDGALLVFLPGLHEIANTRELLLRQPIFGEDFNNEEKYKILLLHSSVPPEEQRAVFGPADPGCRKIILSTNIAETSITVPDAKYVIDSGKLREARYDQTTRITRLVCTWEAQSNARQRAGRAGRVQEGHYYALYSEARKKALAVAVLPELLRSDLQETCLSIKAQGFQEPVANYLSQAIQPPSSTAVKVAVQKLQTIEAFTEDEKLTTLGKMLSKLPLHPSLGKMLILGIIFRCLDPLLILSLVGGDQNLFVRPLEKRRAAKEAHLNYAGNESDHLAKLKAFQELRLIQATSGTHAAYQHARSRFIHYGVFRSISNTAQQIEQILQDVDLIPRDRIDLVSRHHYGNESLNEHSDKAGLIKCLLVCGLRPNIAVRGAGRAWTHRTPTAQNVIMHSGFVSSAGNVADRAALYTFGSLAKGMDDKVTFMREATAVDALTVMLFGGKLHTENWKTLYMDGWLPFKIMGEDPEFATRLILEFRKALDRMLNGAFKSLSADGGRSLANDPVSNRIVDAIVELLGRDGSSEQRAASLEQQQRRRREHSR